jgi:hypothetical protein
MPWYSTKRISGMMESRMIEKVTPVRGGGGWDQTCSVSGRGLKAIDGDGQDRKTDVWD